MTNLNSMWFLNFKGSEEEKNELKETIRRSRTVLDKLLEIVEFEVDNLKIGASDYTKAAWPYEQADKIGQLRILNKLKLLLTQGT